MRTTEIRDNLESIEKTSWKFDIVKEENIKEAESMIFELNKLLKDWRIFTSKLCYQLEEKREDWQNLLNWLRSLK